MKSLLHKSKIPVSSENTARTYEKTNKYKHTFLNNSNQSYKNSKASGINPQEQVINDIIIRNIPSVSKSITTRIGNNIELNDDEDKDKLTSLQKLQEIKFDEENDSDPNLLTSVSFKKESKNRNLNKNKKKTFKQIREEKLLEVDENEIRSIVRELEDKIDKEIEEELKQEEKNKENPDEARANHILKNDDLIKRAYDNGLVTKQEIILFIDYYEILANINQKKLNVIQILENIVSECPLVKEKDYWEKLRESIENTFQMKDAVLDYASQSKTDITNESILTEKDRNNNEVKPLDQVIITQKFGNKLISFKNKYNNISENSLRSSDASLKQTSSRMKIPKNFDLHDDIQLNHLHVNQNAKKLAITKDFKSKNSSLFNFKPKISDNEEEIRNKFIDLLELPQKVLNEIKLPENRKSYVKSKIYDALNYVKEKKMQLKGKR